jgi:hypothetical protein
MNNLQSVNYDENIREIGDRIANLAPNQANELNHYLEKTHNIKTKNFEFPPLKPPYEILD